MTVSLSRLRRPIVQTLFDTLLARINSGEYKPGAWLPTERELSMEFGVDRYAVRAVLAALAESGQIVRQPGKRPWVREAADSRNGVPVVQSVNRRDPLRFISVILPQHLLYPTSHAILCGIQSALRQSQCNRRLVLFDNNDSTPELAHREYAALEAALEDGAAGVILWHKGGDTTLPLLQKLAANQVPVVYVDRYPQSLHCDFVGIDNGQCAADAVEYFVGLGHSRIGLVSNDEGVTAVYEREAGFLDSMSQHGLQADEGSILHIPFSGHPGGEIVHEFMNRKRPTAIFCVNDYSAFRTQAILEEQGIVIPRDVSIAGCDDIERFSPRPAVLTTFRQPWESIGVRAGKLLLKRLAETETTPNMHIMLSAALLERTTSGPANQT